MRLLILAAQYFPVVGGSEVQTRLLAREFRGQGHQVAVWTRRTDSAQPAEDELDGVRIRRLGPAFATRAAWARRAQRLAFLIRVHHELRAHMREFDVVFCNQPQYPATVAALVGRNSGVPVVVRAAASGPKSEMRSGEWSFRLQRRALLRGVRLVVALGPVTQDECQAAGFASSRVAIVPNGVVLSSTASDNRGEPPPLRVIWLGKLRAEKRADLALQAWRLAAIPGELNLVGDGDQRDSILRLIAQVPGGSSTSVRVTGFKEDPRGELATAHVFLQSSDTEGMSNALIEAMGAGCACVATDVGETRFVLGGLDAGEIPEGSFLETEAGLLVRPGDAIGMAAALRGLADSGRAGRLGRAASLRSRANHDIVRVARQYEHLFAGLLTGGGGAGA